MPAGLASAGADAARASAALGEYRAIHAGSPSASAPRLTYFAEVDLRRVVDLSQELWGPMFEPLRDPARFAQVGLDEHGAICWPNGADLAPDAIYEDLTSGTSAAR